jgi:signal peptidase I
VAAVLLWYIVAAVDAFRLARRRQGGPGPWWGRWPLVLGFGVALNLAMGLAPVEAGLNLGRYRVCYQRSANMQPTLRPGDRLVLDTAFGPDRPLRRGDLVAVTSPDDGLLWVLERCVALGGDKVEVRERTFYLNDVPQATWEPPDYLPPNASHGPFILEPGTFYCLGDNLGNSWDSRAWGPLPVASVQGRALYGLRATGGLRLFSL